MGRALSADRVERLCAHGVNVGLQIERHARAACLINTEFLRRLAPNYLGKCVVDARVGCALE